MLTQKQQAIAIDLATGVSQRATAKKFGVHYMTITLWKRSSDFVSEVERLRNQFRQVATKEAQGAPKSYDA